MPLFKATSAVLTLFWNNLIKYAEERVVDGIFTQIFCGLLAAVLESLDSVAKKDSHKNSRWGVAFTGWFIYHLYGIIMINLFYFSLECCGSY